MIKEKSVMVNAELSEDVLQYVPTKHGGNIYKIAGQLGIPETELIDFSASINPLGLSKRVKETIRKGMNGLVNYPDPDTSMLRQKIAEHHDIDPATILCGNGSTELIYLIPRALKPERVLIPAPTFSEYERACKLSNELRVVSYELKEENNFRIITDEFISAINTLSFNSQLLTPDSKLIFLCNPNNPTGALLKREEIAEIAEAAGKQRCYLVVDEAFIDFTPEASVINDVRDNPYLIVLRSMTKFHALTGLRIGYAVFHKDLIGRVLEFKEPWTVNNLAQQAAVTALDDKEYARQTFELIKREKAFMEKVFRKLEIQFYPSAANYYLLKIPSRPPLSKGGITEALRQKGILVRDCSNFRGLDGSYIRVAVKSRTHNRKLLKEFSPLWKRGVGEIF